MRKFNVLVSVPNEGSFNLTDVIFEMITPVEAVSEPEVEIADLPELSPELCLNYNNGCRCVMAKGHEGQHNCGISNYHYWGIEAPLSPETETPPVKVGDKIKRTAFDLHNAWTSAETVPLGSTGIVKRVDKGNGKKAHHKWSILVDTGKGFRYWLTANEYEIIPESESISESEGMTVAELIGKLQKVTNQSAKVFTSQLGVDCRALIEITDDGEYCFSANSKDE